MRWLLFGVPLLFFTVLGWQLVPAADSDTIRLLNVSYDPTRELFQDYNAVFTQYWEGKTGQKIKIRQSHGGSGKQARAVIEGLRADVVTLALSYDIDVIAKHSKKISADWESKLPYYSAPYTSTIVFLVRKDNPKQITDWKDMVRDDVKVITPNPKTSGGARWNYLAAWAYASRALPSHDDRLDYMRKLFANVPVLDGAARGATTTFAQRKIGDVLITWENEAHLAIQQLGRDRFEIIYPSISILAEPPVALVEGNAERKGHLEIAQAYLSGLYSEQAQGIAAKHFFRPRNQKVLRRHRKQFPEVRMISIRSLGGWEKAQQMHFGNDGIFDQIYAPK